MSESEVERVAGERVGLIAKKYTEGCTDEELGRIDELTERLRELLPPIDLEPLRELARSGKERARKIKALMQKLGLET